MKSAEETLMELCEAARCESPSDLVTWVTERASVEFGLRDIPSEEEVRSAIFEAVEALEVPRTDLVAKRVFARLGNVPALYQRCLLNAVGDRAIVLNPSFVLDLPE